MRRGHRMCLVCVPTSDWDEEWRLGVTRDQGGRMPEDPWPLIGHRVPVLACDWLPGPHCSIPGRWGLQ